MKYGCLFYCSDYYGWSANKLVQQHTDVPEKELPLPSMMGGEAAVGRHGGRTARLTLPCRGGGRSRRILRFLASGRPTSSPPVTVAGRRVAHFLKSGGVRRGRTNYRWRVKFPHRGLPRPPPPTVVAGRLITRSLGRGVRPGRAKCASGTFSPRGSRRSAACHTSWAVR